MAKKQGVLPIRIDNKLKEKLSKVAAKNNRSMGDS